MERVTAELTWAARNRIAVVGLADANFGILERDLEIARFVASLKREYGYPLQFQMNNAKNATSRVTEIVRIAREAGLVSQGVLSIQTRDADVLAVVKRKNISPSRYDDLLREFRSDNLPVHTEIMMALPGSSYGTFVRDLQWACDHDLTAHVAWTGVLPNTPMADPEYIARYRIRTVAESRLSDPDVLQALGLNAFPPNLVVSTTTFTEDEFLAMARLSALFHLFQGESILKYVMLFLARERGVSEITFLEDLRDADLERYPILRDLRDWKIARDGSRDPLSETVLHNRWDVLYDEVEDYVNSVYGKDLGAFRVVMQVQRFVMAWSGRVLPAQLQMEHDFVRYREDVRAGGRDARLERYAPGTLMVSDPGRVCGPADRPSLYEPHCGAFELDSELSRSRIGPFIPRSAKSLPAQQGVT
jgi:hypothetical protein